MSIDQIIGTLNRFHYTKSELLRITEDTEYILKTVYSPNSVTYEIHDYYKVDDDRQPQVHKCGSIKECYKKLYSLAVAQKAKIPG